ncbi:MAG: 30S ribosomal protein S5 [Rickettsiales bacterium]|nr:30S ribosomal protein S5 [Rickettsiales bacterium]
MAKKKIEDQGNVSRVEEEIKETLVLVNRTTKVVKGGRKFGFAAVIIAGDSKGRVGYGLGKAKEVAEARAKASKEARRNLMFVPLKEGRTLFHDVKGSSGAGNVLLRQAKPGTGIIAGGAMRAVFEMLGVHDIVTKSIGSNNVHNIIAATFDALKKVNTPKYIAAKREKNIDEL